MASSLWSTGASIALLAVVGCSAQYIGGSEREPEPEPNEVTTLTLANAVDEDEVTLECVYVFADPSVRYRLEPEDADINQTSLKVYARPEDDWREDCWNDFTEDGTVDSESRIAVVLIIRDENGEDVYAKHVLAYVDQDIRPGTRSARFVGGELTFGSHLLKVIPCEDDDEGPMDRDCLEPAHPKTPIRMTSGGGGGGTPQAPRLAVN